MKLTLKNGACGGGGCPTLWKTDRGTYVVQGAVVQPSEVEGVIRTEGSEEIFELPQGEGLVEIPSELLVEIRGAVEMAGARGNNPR